MGPAKAWVKGALVGIGAPSPQRSVILVCLDGSVDGEEDEGEVNRHHSDNPGIQTGRGERSPILMRGQIGRNRRDGGRS